MGDLSGRGSRLTLHDVKRIKELLLEGLANVQVAHLMGCSPETVGRIKRGAAHAGVRVPGDEVLRPADRQGEVGEMRTAEIMRLIAPRHEPVSLPAATAEEEAAAFELATKHARILAEEKAKEEAQEAKEAEENRRLEKEFEGKGVSAEEYFAKKHLKAIAQYDATVAAMKGEGPMPEIRFEALPEPLVRTAAELEEIRRLQEGEM
jgi:IS30 family transposase